MHGQQHRQTLYLSWPLCRCNGSFASANKHGLILLEEAWRSFENAPCKCWLLIRPPLFITWTEQPYGKLQDISPVSRLAFTDVHKIAIMAALKDKIVLVDGAYFIYIAT